MIKIRAKSWLNVKGLQKVMKQASVRPMMRCGLAVERNAKMSMRRGGGGKQRRGEGGRFVKGTRSPSMPGTPPSVQTGVLRASISTAPTKTWTVVVGPTSPPAWYGVVHEFGGRHHPPRPFMRPALFRIAPKYPEFFRNLPLFEVPATRRMEAAVTAWQRKWGGTR